MTSTHKGRAILIWGLAAAFFLGEYFARVAPSVMVPELMRAFSANAFSLGSLSAFFYYSYVAMQVPVGTLVDRFGAHKLLTVMAALCGLSTIAFAYSPNLHIASLIRFVTGFSAAFAFVGALKLAHVWFPARRFGLLAGATQALGMLGAAIGEGPVAILVNAVGWKISILIIGGFLLFLSALIGLFVRDHPNHVVERKRKEQSYPSYTLLRGLWLVLKNSQTWINGLIVGLLYAPTAAFAELWGISYLRQVYRISNGVAGSAISMIFVGWAIAGPLAGMLSDHLRRRKPVIITSAFLGLVIFSIILYVPSQPVWLLFVLLFCYGVSNVGVAVCYAVASEIITPRLAGTSMAFANMASVIIGTLLQPIIGFILDRLWDGQIIDGVRVYSSHDFRTAVFVLPLCFIFCLIGCVFLKESFHGHVENTRSP